MKLTVGSGGLPVGSYRAKFTELKETSHQEFGAGLQFSFEVTAGELKGKSTSRITGTRPTGKNGCGKMLSGLLGRPLTPGEEIDVNQFAGREYMVIVEATDSGATRVGAVVPVN